VRLLSEVPGIKLIAAEPHVQALPHELENRGIVFTDPLSAIDRADIVVLLVDHRQFNFIDPDSLKDKKLVDTRGLWTWRKARKPDARIEGAKSRNARNVVRLTENAA
jgi:UDP-N-acetyl-D-mannosaminuronic acid dehydrogenase